MATIDFHPLAIAEARAARRRYSQIRPALGARFLVALDAAVAAIEASPASYSPYLHGTRFLRLKKFPYLLVYLELSADRVLAVAVAHSHRRPGYWRRRLP